MKSPFCIMESSAMPSNTKTASLAQDLVRRMMNISESRSQEERNIVTEKYIQKLRRSGYSTTQTKEIVEAGLKGYESKREKCLKNGIELHRSAQSTVKARFVKKLTSRTNWFRKGRGNKIEKKEKGKPKYNRKKIRESKARKEIEPVTVMFVPRTPGGALISRLRKVEEEISQVTGDKVKLVERSGKMLKRMLQITDPEGNSSCQRPTCLVCCNAVDEKDVGKCRKRNITYQTTCQQCKAVGKKVNYYGESSRTAFERGHEHWKDLEGEKEDSHMWKHVSTEHAEAEKEKVIFSMKVMKNHKSALQRQVHEAILIELHEGEPVMNSKGEYNRCTLPRLSVMFGESNTTESNSKDDMSHQEIEELLSRRTENKRKDGNEEGIRDFQPKSKRRKRFQIQESNKDRKRKETADRFEPESKKSRTGGSYQGKIVETNVKKISDYFGQNSHNQQTISTKITLKTSKCQNQGISKEKVKEKIKLFNNLNGESKQRERKNESNQKKIIQFFRAANQDSGQGKSKNKAQPNLSPGNLRQQHPPKYTPAPVRGLVRRSSAKKLEKKPTKNKSETKTKLIYNHFKVIRTESESPSKK